MTPSLVLSENKELWTLAVIPDGIIVFLGNNSSIEVDFVWAWGGVGGSGDELSRFKSDICVTNFVIMASIINGTERLQSKG